MAVTIDLSWYSSDMVSYFAFWDALFETPNYGSFWNSTDGLQDGDPDPIDPGTTWTEWGAYDNSTFLNAGVTLEGSMQYSQGNLTGTVDTIELGYLYSESNASGVSLGLATMEIANDTSYNLSGYNDLFDYAIYDLTINGSTFGLYTYFGVVGADINDTSLDDVLVGFAGADTFVFSSGDDEVTAGATGTYGYQDGTDILDISAWGVTAFSSLSISDDGTDSLIEFGSDSITLAGVADSSVLDVSDFLLA